MRKAALNASAASDCEAEVVREHPQADQAGEPAGQNAGGDEQGAPDRAGAAHVRRLRSSPRTAPRAQSRSSSGAASPSVPVDFFIR